MSITDELRKYADGLSDEAARKSEHGFSPVAMKLEGIADRIDAEHERLMAGRRRSCVFYDAERNYCKVHDEGDMADFGWTRLPQDADGEYICIGDVMEWCDSGETLTVEGIGSDVLFYIDGENAEWTAARNKRHHHEPTVEDVLRDVVTLCHNTWKEESPFQFYDVDDVMKSGNIAEYAAKLRLAGENA